MLDLFVLCVVCLLLSCFVYLFCLSFTRSFSLQFKLHLLRKSPDCFLSDAPQSVFLLYYLSCQLFGCPHLLLLLLLLARSFVMEEIAAHIFHGSNISVSHPPPPGSIVLPFSSLRDAIGGEEVTVHQSTSSPLPR